MEKIVLVEGSHCFKCAHWSDYTMEEAPGLPIMRTVPQGGL